MILRSVKERLSPAEIGMQKQKYGCEEGRWKREGCKGQSSWVQAPLKIKKWINAPSEITSLKCHVSALGWFAMLNVNKKMVCA